MNRVILIGRLTRDPELRNTASGMAVCQITVAVNRRTSQSGAGPEADFISVNVWDKQAENVAKYLKKGSQVAVEGRIQTRNYENNEGRRVYVTEVVASNVQFLDPKNSTSTTTTSNASSGPSPFDFETNNTPVSGPTMASTPSPVSVDNDPFANFGERIDVSDNDLPF